MFDLNQLRCFVTVAEELHFGRAALRLHMTQPPLSRQIQLLEHNIGTPLFTRANRMVRLTPAGRSLLPEARTLLRLAEKARVSALRTGQGDAGRIVIGFTAAAGYEFLPAILAELRRSLPGVALELREMVSRWQLEALDNGELDIGLLRPTQLDLDSLRSECVAREALLAALPLDHPLAQRKKLHLEDFDGQVMVMYSPDEAQYFHELVRHAFARVGVTPRYDQHVTQVHSVLAVVRAGLGAALVPETASGLWHEGVVYRRLDGFDPTHPVELHLVWKNDNDNPALARALPLLKGFSLPKIHRAI